jgi:hypothetical protein
MSDISQIWEHMEVIGADGVYLGTIDRVEGERIKLTRNDSGEGLVMSGWRPFGNVIVDDV